MDFVNLFRFVHSGVSSNFWGLGCPFYCGPSSFAALALAFILGFGCAAGLAAWALFYLWVHNHFNPGPSSSAPPSATALRLRQYVDARR